MSFFSELVCACGCDNLLPRTIADRGWRYLRGHKPKGVAPARRMAKPRAPRTAPATSTTPASIVAFLRARLAILEEEEAVAAKRLELELELHTRLRLRLGIVRIALQHVEELTGAEEVDPQQ